MRFISTVMLAIVLLVLGVWVEMRAVSCGASCFDARLPHGLRADWFNGGFWLTDAEGWGVVTPPIRLELRDGVLLEVKRIEGYTREMGFVVEVLLTSGEHVLISFEDSTALSPKFFTRDSTAIDDFRSKPSWRRVDPGSCFYGRFSVARALIVTSFLALMVLAFRMSGCKLQK